MKIEKRLVACFVGHRTTNLSTEQKEKLEKLLEHLIEVGVSTFLLGSRSRFDDLCHELVTRLRERNPVIKRIYVRAEYPDITDEYEKYLLKSYEHTYYPSKIRGSGRAVYVERNFEMIDNSDYCVFFTICKTLLQKVARA